MYCFASLLSELPESKYGFLLQEFFYNTTFTETLTKDMMEELRELQRSYVSYCFEGNSWRAHAIYAWKLVINFFIAKISE